VFDTIYAHQDVACDVVVGVKSTAVLCRGGRARGFLWTLWAAMSGALVLSGRLGGLGPAYYVVTAGGAMASVGVMVAKVDLEDPVSCWAWFSQGFWMTGLVIVGGLGLEYGVGEALSGHA